MSIQKAIVDRKIFSFPLSDEQVEVFVYKNADGSFKNAESICPVLKKNFILGNDYLLGLFEIEENKGYTLCINTMMNVGIYEYNLTESKRIDYQTGELKYKLTDVEIDGFREIVIEGITNFLDLFVSYYNKREKDYAVDNDQTNGALATFLRFTIGAKIRFLEEFCSMYLALNGQTYFDVIGHVIMSGAYTFSSLFSTSGLYLAANKTLVGKELLQLAVRKLFLDEESANAKGEIHTKQGLTILHARQFRLRQKRTPKINLSHSYEPISIVDEGSLIRNSPVKVHDDRKRRCYEGIKNYSVLNFEGVQMQTKLQTEFVHSLSEDELKVIDNLKVSSMNGYNSLFPILESEKVSKVLDRVSTFMCPEMLPELCKKIGESDYFVSTAKKEKAKKYIVPLLGLLQPELTMSDYEDSFLLRFRNVEDVTSILIEILENFKSFCN